MEISDMVLTGGDSGEIMSGGFNVESILLKRQLATTDENVYKSLRNTVIPFGLLHENVNQEKEKSLSSFLTDGLESQIIDDELYSKLLRDYSASDETLFKKKKNKSNKCNKKDCIKKTKHKKTYKMK